MEPTKPSSQSPSPQGLHDLISRWPESWKGSDEDLPIGRALVAEILPFVDHLVAKGLAPKTVRRHVDNLWAIGGQIISDLGTYPEDRAHSALELLREAIDCGEAHLRQGYGGQAPLIHPLDEAGQRACDATARKLWKWMGQSRRPVRAGPVAGPAGQVDEGVNAGGRDATGRVPQASGPSRGQSPTNWHSDE